MKSPVALKFGVENYELSPVPPGEVKTVRPGVGHHHVGVEETCQPPARTSSGHTDLDALRQGGNGYVAGIQLNPGEHKLSLQFADDMHNAIEGLC